MRLEIARGDVYEGKTKFKAGSVLKVICECKGRFIERYIASDEKESSASASRVPVFCK